MSQISHYKKLNTRKTWLLFTLFLIVVIGIGWAFSQIYASPVILYIAVGLSLVMNIGAYWFSDKIVLKMSKAVPADKNAYPELYEAVERLSKKADLPMPKVYIVNAEQPNAFATGKNPEHAVVAVTTGLLNRLNKDELEGVIAHELSHISNRDMLVSTATVVLLGFVSILADFFLRSLFFRAIFDGKRQESSAAVMLIGIVLSILAPLGAMLIQLAISRKREFMADAGGAELTKNPRGLADALIKISKDPHPLPMARNTTSHLWISDPFKGKVAFHKFFMSHPPVEERVKALNELVV